MKSILTNSFTALIFRQICEMFCLSSQILITNQTKLAETLNEPQPRSAVDLLMSYFVPIINQHDLFDYYGNVPKKQNGNLKWHLP